MNKKQVVVSIFFLLIFIGVLGMMSGYLTSWHNTYKGDKKFDTIEEAQVYQKEILQYAEDNNFDVETKVIISSPPKLEYTIWTGKSCEYGSRSFSDFNYKVGLVFVWIIAPIVIIGALAVGVINDSKDAKQD